MENKENKENKEYKVSEEMKREGQCELDDDAIEQAAGGRIPENPWDANTSRAWAEDALERIKQQCT